MPHERGFTLTEMTAALFVLSLGMISLGEVTSLLFRSWEQTQTWHTRVSADADLLSEIDKGERQLKSEFDLALQPLIEIDNGPPLLLAVPKIDRPASCEYDLVGRRCR